MSGTSPPRQPGLPAFSKWIIFALQCILILFAPVTFAVFLGYAVLLYLDGHLLASVGVFLLYSVCIWTLLIGYWTRRR